MIDGEPHFECSYVEKGHRVNLEPWGRSHFFAHHMIQCNGINVTIEERLCSLTSGGVIAADNVKSMTIGGKDCFQKWQEAVQKA